MIREAAPNAHAGQRLAEAVGRCMFERDRAARALGIALLDIRPGGARASMSVRSDMMNGHDICQGGFIFALADAAFAYACNSYNRNAVAQHCTITFLQPAQQGDVLTAEAQERALRGKNGVYDITVINQKGAVIALFRGNSRVIKGRVVSGPLHSGSET